MDRPALITLDVADPPGRWQALGFTVADAQVELGGVRLRLGVRGTGITAWVVRGIEPVASIDGLPTEALASIDRAPTEADASVDRASTEADASVDRASTEAGGGPASPPRAAHPNGAIGLDQLVIAAPDFDRTSQALATAGMPLRRVSVIRGVRHGFRRLGPAILELVEAPDERTAGFWGLAVVVEDLVALARRLGDQLAPIKPAVQPGRQIATLRDSAGLSTKVAFIDRDVR